MIGNYQTRRLLTTTLQEQILPDIFVLGRSSKALIYPDEQDMIRVAAGLGEEAEVRSFRRAFMNRYRHLVPSLQEENE